MNQTEEIKLMTIGRKGDPNDLKSVFFKPTNVDTIMVMVIFNKEIKFVEFNNCAVYLGKGNTIFIKNVTGLNRFSLKHAETLYQKLIKKLGVEKTLIKTMKFSDFKKFYDNEI